MSRAISIHSVSFNLLTKSPKRWLFSIQRSIHDSYNRIYNHCFNIGYGLEILREAPSGRLNCTESETNGSRRMNLNLLSLIPATATFIAYIIYIFWCYNSKTEADEDEQ